MKEQIISFKYDGPSERIQGHQIDALVLASALEGFAGLIAAADLAINESESGVKVTAQAGFVKGSFGVDLIVFADIVILEAIGLIAAVGAGSVLSVLKDLKGVNVESIEVEEGSDLAKVITSKGDEITTTKTVATLIDNMEVRRQLDKVIHQPLDGDEISSLKLFSHSIVDAQDDEPTFEIDSSFGACYKKPSTTQTIVKKITESKAAVEFVAGNRNSGTSGWKMNYLDKKNISVKILDKAFLNKIKKSDAPAIFSGKFKVELKTVVRKKNGLIQGKAYSILKVIGPNKR